MKGVLGARLRTWVAIPVLMRVATGLAPAASAPSAARVVAEYLRAKGGAKALARVHTVRFEGTLTEPGIEATGSYLLILEEPNRFYEEAAFGGETTREAYNGKSAWRQDHQGLRTLTGEEATLAEATARYRNGGFLSYKKEKDRLQLLGPETVRGRRAEKVEATTTSGAKRQVFFDEASHLIVEEAVPAGDGSEERVFYRDYRLADGIAEPYGVEYRQGGHTWNVAITGVRHNAPVNEALFDFPSISNQPLPDIANLLREVEKNQKTIDHLVEQYACEKSEEEFEVDSRGAVQSKGVKEYEVFYLGGDEVDRLVRKDGKDLSPAEQQKEKEKIEKRIAQYEKREAKPAQQGEDEGKRKKDEVEVSDFLRMDRFTDERRETFRDHGVIVFDFEPNPAYHPGSTLERLLHELVGAVWIDEQARQVVRLEAYLHNSFKLGGGLFASLQKGSAFTFEQAKINDEVWLPSHLEAHVSARLLLLKGFHGNFTDRYSDYRKFHVESVTKPGACH